MTVPTTLTEAKAALPDNVARLITPLIHREVVEYLAKNFQDKSTPTPKELSIEALVADEFLKVSADGTKIESDIVLLVIPDGSITAAKLAPNAVTTPKIAPDAVTLAKMATFSVGSDEVVNQSLNPADLVPGLTKRIPNMKDTTIEAEGTPSADDIRFTIQARDANNINALERNVIDIWVSTAFFGAPGGTHTITVDTGTLISPAPISNTEAFRVMSDAAGLVKIIVNVTGAGNRSLMASVNGSQVEAKFATWV